MLKKYAEMGWEKEGRPRVSGVWICDESDAKRDRLTRAKYARYLKDEEFLAARTILSLSTIF